MLSEQLISVYSLTYAYKAKQILDKHGIESIVVSQSQDKLKKGCGYSIVVDGNINAALSILNQAGIKIR